MSEHEKDEIEQYGDESIASYHGTVPNWLKYQYVFWLAWGVVWLWLFWNGSWGYFDRGYWQQLQRAANTTFPMINHSEAPNSVEK
jgi:hypothetical protein